MITFIFILAAAVLVMYMIRYARRYGAGETRDESESTQDGWDTYHSGSSDPH